MSKYERNRRTGRTTRIIEAAIKAAMESGETVEVIDHHHPTSWYYSSKMRLKETVQHTVTDMGLDGVLCVGFRGEVFVKKV